MKIFNKIARNKGSALVATMIFAMVAIMGMAAVLRHQVQTNKLNETSFTSRKAMLLAEAGIHLALFELNYNVDTTPGSEDNTEFNGDHFTWTTVGSVKSLTRNFADGQIKVDVDITDVNDIIITSYGTVNGMFSFLKKGIQVRSKIDPNFPINSKFPGAIASLSDIDFNNGVIIDSYSNGEFDIDFYDDTNPAGGIDPFNYVADVLNTWRPSYNGHIFSKGASIILNQNSMVRGTVYKENVGVPVSSGSTATGFIVNAKANEAQPVGDYAGADENDHQDCGGTVGTYPTPAPAVVPDYLELSGTPNNFVEGSGASNKPGLYNSTSIGTNKTLVLTGGFYKVLGSINCAAKSTLVLEGDTEIYIADDNAGDLGDFIVPGNGGIVYGIKNYDAGTDTTYKLRIFVNGSLNIGQGASLNVDSSYTPSSLEIHGVGLGFNESPADKITISNGGTFIGTIYAPNYEVELNQGVDVCGAFNVYKILPMAKGRIHFDERLWGDPDADITVQYGISAWQEV